MPSLTEFLRRFRGDGPKRDLAENPKEGIEALLDGATAVAMTEACLAGALPNAASFPAARAVRAWNNERNREEVNLFGRSLITMASGRSRGSLSTGMGLSLAGVRPAIFMAGSDVASALDLMTLAAGRHLPLVINMSCRVLSANGASAGSGHDAYHLAADTGFFLLFARNVQEAVDLNLIARRVAERALIPGLVAMDGHLTALAPQNVQLLGPATIRKFTGNPQDEIPAPTPSQEMLFGPMRRRVPRRFNLDRPALQGAYKKADMWGLGMAARRPFFYNHLSSCLDEAMASFAKKTGRLLDPISVFREGDAEILLVGQGAAVETLERVASRLRDREKMKIGVLGIRTLRPFPARELTAILRGKKRVIVLERVDTPLSTDPPLTRELRALIDEAIENGSAAPSREGAPSWSGPPPHLHSAIYGIGGFPLREADLEKWIHEVAKGGRSRVYLGIDFLPAHSSYPKREILLERVRRDYPDVAELGVHSTSVLSADKAAGCGAKLSVAFIRNEGEETGAIAAEAAALLYKSFGGGARCRPELIWDRRDRVCIDRIVLGEDSILEPGDDHPIDVAVVTDSDLNVTLPRMAVGGALLVVTRGGEEEPLRLAPALHQKREEWQLDLYAVPANEPASGDSLSADPASGDFPSRISERILGALTGLLAKRDSDLKPRKILSSYEEFLHEQDDAEGASRLDSFRSGMENVQLIQDPGIAERAAAVEADPEIPMSVRRLGRIDADDDNLSRFWDQVGVLYQKDEEEQITPDPYLALGTVPPLSSTFRDLSKNRKIMPHFNPAPCTGCGNCWSVCPEGAIGPIALSAVELLEAGIRMAKARGDQADALRPVVAKLAARTHSLLLKGKAEAPSDETLGGPLTTAFNWLMEKMAPSAERRKELESAFKPVAAAVGKLPVACTIPFLEEPEKKAPGSGSLLSVVINPETCKGCSACITSCEPGAMTAGPQTPDRQAAAQALRKVWEELPDTSGENISRLSHHPDVGQPAAMLLSRHCSLSPAGGDGAEAGSGEKTALRWVLAAAEYHLQPLLQDHLKKIASLQDRLAAKIRETLADALPTEDLQLLSSGLDSLGRQDLDLAAFAEKINEACKTKQVDGERLGRLVDSAQRLVDHRWRLEKGPAGMGRARAAMAVAEGSTTSWAGSFPYNPYALPIVLDDSGETVELAKGLAEGLLDEVLEDFRDIRRALLELDKPLEAIRSVRGLEKLTWRDLTPEERSLCPSLILVGDGRVLGGESAAQLASLLGSDLPVKVVLLSDLAENLDPGMDALNPGLSTGGAGGDPGILGLMQRNAYIVQSSIAHGAHLTEGVLKALRHPGPALIHIHAPKPDRHGFAEDIAVEHAGLAVRSRAFPLYTYDPAAEGVFGARLDLSGNQNMKADWTQAEGVQGDGIQSKEGSFTTVFDWMVTERRFVHHFSDLQASDPSPTPIIDYLRLPALQRFGKTPLVVVKTAGKNRDATRESAERRLKCSPAAVAFAQWRLDIWRMLQEWAGLVTPFTQRVKEEAAAEVQAHHEAQLAALRNDYEGRINDIGDEIRAEMAQRLQQRMMALAGHRRSPGNGQDEDAAS
ncbi:MAG: 4Fe-4S binding protein [Candidatus Eisenbacteria bacterium]|uniref:4Fe-4S binding protein n=1 Tax=Eiseniibacteriota bacterium TaxID=2212470 RepID=A0A948RVY9_UNCEI|nr:4Fe-4S binding protein [Candidatus Eisenbacteria bacterium]